ncbi:TMAO reductase system periplasmic protein TorT [Shewanella carassii]|uniref:TMAO reductase system periplasmic protein TorT n=1 Tax=Shewanella carassii TaxID=1987584 RepID=UPI001BEF2B3E|nr:TMAO reductase system periplasmic protein TorT [Shewanella carassii]BCV67507.1 TMAO reductase system periplasmic protein TorT [Shewanella carassii]
MSQFAATFEAVLPVGKKPLQLWSLLLLWLCLPPAQAYEAWELEQRSPFNEAIQQASPLTHTPLTKANKPWKLCALVPHLKDAYWIGINYGLAKQSQVLGLGLELHEAGGYGNTQTQLAQLKSCLDGDADAILLGAVSPHLLENQTLELTKPVLALVNQLADSRVQTHIGVNWYQMGYLTGQFLASTPYQRLAMLAGPEGRGGTDLVEKGVRQALQDSTVEIVAVMHADNNRNLYRDQLNLLLNQNKQPLPQALLGSAVAIEAAMGTLRQGNMTDKMALVSSYLSPDVMRGLKRNKVAYANDDRVVLQGRLAVDLAVRRLQGEKAFGDIGPAILQLRPDNLNSMQLDDSLAPADFYPVYRVEAKASALNH